MWLIIFYIDIFFSSFFFLLYVCFLGIGVFSLACTRPSVSGVDREPPSLFVRPLDFSHLHRPRAWHRLYFLEICLFLGRNSKEIIRMFLHLRNGDIFGSERTQTSSCGNGSPHGVQWDDSTWRGFGQLSTARPSCKAHWGGSNELLNMYNELTEVWADSVP